MFMKNYKSVLKNQDFMILTISNTFSRLGTRISYIALMAKAFEITNNPLTLGIVSILDLIPSIICGGILAYFVDHLSKKRIIFLCSLVCVLSSACLAFTDSMAIIYFLVFLTGGMDELVYSAKSALEPQLVIKNEDLLYFNSLKSFLAQATSIVGPALGGVLIAIYGFKWAFIVNAVSYGIPVVGILFLRYEEKRISVDEKTLFSGKRIMQGNREGFKYIGSIPEIRQIFIVNAVIQLVYGLQGPLLFPFVKEIFQLDSSYAGFLFSASGIGGLLGSILAVKLYKDNILDLFSKILFIDGCMFLIFTQSKIFLLSILLFTFAGAIGTIFETISNSAIQKVTNKDFLGRVFAAQGLVSNPINMMASGLGGILANTFTVYSIFSISAIGEMLIACKMRISARKR